MGVRSAFDEEDLEVKRTTGENLVKAILAARTDSEKIEFLCTYIEKLEERIQSLEVLAVDTYYDD